MTYFNPGSTSRSYNILVDESSTSTSYENEDGYSQINGGLMTRVESFGSNEGNEIVGSRYPSTIVAKSSQGNQLWNYTTNQRTYSVDIGGVSPESAGNEVIVATQEKLRIIDSSGNLLETHPSTGDIWFRSTTLLDVDSDSRSEIIAGTDGGQLYAYDDDLSEIWNRNLGNQINSLESGDITKNTGTEIIAGLDSGEIVLLNETGSTINTYQRGSGIEEVERGDIRDTDGDELGISTTNSQILNFYDLPYDLSLDVSGTEGWSSNGLFMGSTTVNEQSLEDEFNSRLSDCSTQTCNVSINFNSNTGGRLQVTDPQIDYGYDLSNTFDYTSG